jgi:hypothetical protein
VRPTRRCAPTELAPRRWYESRVACRPAQNARTGNRDAAAPSHPRGLVRDDRSGSSSARRCRRNPLEPRSFGRGSIVKAFLLAARQSETCRRQSCARSHVDRSFNSSPSASHLAAEANSHEVDLRENFGISSVSQALDLASPRPMPPVPNITVSAPQPSSYFGPCRPKRSVPSPTRSTGFCRLSTAATFSHRYRSCTPGTTGEFRLSRTGARVEAYQNESPRSVFGTRCGLHPASHRDSSQTECRTPLTLRPAW